MPRFNEILQPKQLKRLKEIYLQAVGPLAVTDPDIAEALELSDEQKKGLQSLNTIETQRIGEREATQELWRNQQESRRSADPGATHETQKNDGEKGRRMILRASRGIKISRGLIATG